MRALVTAAAILAFASTAAAQSISQRGLIEASGFGFPQTAANDSTRLLGDVLFREELFLRPADWLRVTAGLDLRANSHDEVENEWRLDFEDRGLRRPRAAVRRLAATLSSGPLTFDIGKQFIRWGRADIIYPTDRFAPRDYLNPIDSEVLPVIAARASVQLGGETFEGVWSPQLTPSRLPLPTQRWVSLPADAAALTIADHGSLIPGGAAFGARWRHTGSRLETALTFFDGANHLPDISVRVIPESATLEIQRVYPMIRMYGGDVAIPTAWFIVKAETAFVTSPAATSDDYVLYVAELERQVGEWLLDIGYAGEAVRERRAAYIFSPDRQLARSVIGRAAYTLDPRRTLTFEGAARQNGNGAYGRVEYSQMFGDHWRLILTGVALGGATGDFLGQYRRNSHAAVALRITF